MRKGLVALVIGILAIGSVALGWEGGHSQIVLQNVTPHKVLYWVTWMNPVDKDGNPLMHWVQYFDPEENYNLKWKLVPVTSMQVMGGEIQPGREIDSSCKYLMGDYTVEYSILGEPYRVPTDTGYVTYRKFWKNFTISANDPGKKCIELSPPTEKGI